MRKDTSMNHQLVISAVGKDSPGIVDNLSRRLLDSGCNIVDSRMTVLGGEFAILLLIDGNWNNIAKLESLIPSLEKRLDMTIISRRTEPRQTRRDLLPYGIEVVSLDQPGIVHNLARFFSSRNINIQEMATTSYSAAHTGTPMVSVNITVDIPADMQISALREEFMDFCDQLNLDAVMEPVKG